MFMGSKMGRIIAAIGTNILSNIRRYRRKKYASNPHLLITVELGMVNSGRIHWYGPLCGIGTRCRSATKKVFGRYMRVSRHRRRQKAANCAPKEMSAEIMAALRVAPDWFVSLSAAPPFPPRKPSNPPLGAVDGCATEPMVGTA